MNKLFKLLAAVAICAAPALPLAASAQTSAPMDKSSAGKVLAPDQPRSESERKATQENGQAPKYGQTDPSATDSMDKGDMSKSKSKAKPMNKVDPSDQPAAGDVPTYPAKTKDGRPTGDSNLAK